MRAWITRRRGGRRSLRGPPATETARSPLATRPYSVSPKILWGNVASALHAVTTQLPPQATPLTQSVLTQPPLADPSGEGYTLEDRVRFLCVCWWLLVSMPSWVSAGLTSGGTLESETVMAQELPRLSARLEKARYN